MSQDDSPSIVCAATDVQKFDINDNSPLNYGDDDMWSTFTSSPDSKKSKSLELTILSSENEKLEKDNKTLSSELTHVKKKYDEFVVFLRNYLKMDHDQINHILGQVSCGSTHETVCYDDDENVVGESGNNLKLFGVWLKEEKNSKHKKRARQDQMGLSGPHLKELKTDVDFSTAMRMMKSNKICN
ncbi:unnamed protein product [Lupinus luteus]|uniref:Uncharacterized protein n=1 Tax=Lupinus luteus TaxID=3873 RepID=A0AAV1WYC0_LUPLU